MKEAQFEDEVDIPWVRPEYRRKSRLRQNTNPVPVKPAKRKPKADDPQRGDESLHYVPLVGGRLATNSNNEKITYQQVLNAHPNYQDSGNLFSFYLGSLGEVEGKNAIQSVLSNQNREMFMTSRKNTRCLRDVMEIPEVKRFVTLLREGEVDNQAIFKAYKALPSPGVSYLSERSRGILLHRFANPQRRRFVDARRYLALIQDMNDAGLHMSASLWTSAIYLTGRSSGRTSKTDLKYALGLWRRMEHEAGIPSTSVTFNILFDIAIKSGQYMVANSLLEEMRKRGIEFSRCGRVTQIYLRGLEQDANGIYKAYNDLVKAGEIVDTVVLNCVMVSLIRAGEFDAAKRMYDRMKGVHEAKVSSHAPGHQFLSDYTPPPTNFSAYRKASKRFGRLLGASAYLSKTHPEYHRTLQAAVPLTPDARTFHMFLSHHSSYRGGDLEAFMAMVNDMETTFSLPPQGMVYTFLFEGFARHGDTKKTLWTHERLKTAWASFLRALHDSKAKIAAESRTKMRREKMEWENPSKRTKDRGDDSEATSERMPYFSFASAKPTQPNDEEIINSPKERKDIADSELDHEDDDTLPKARTHFEGTDEDEDFDESIHGVYLGRRIVLACIRAFYVCGGPDAALDVWVHIQRLWKPELRKLADVIAVKAQLNELISKGSKDR